MRETWGGFRRAQTFVLALDEVPRISQMDANESAVFRIGALCPRFPD